MTMTPCDVILEVNPEVCFITISWSRNIGCSDKTCQVITNVEAPLLEISSSLSIAYTFSAEVHLSLN